MTLVALIICLLVSALGALGIASPSRFLGVVRRFQTPTGLYFATAVRVVLGAALLFFAPASRAPGLLLILGVIIILKGVITPLIGVEVLLSYLRTGAPYVDSLDAYFGTVYGFQHIELNTAGYESLKSQGLELISDDGLRSHVARVYEQTYPNAERAIASERGVVLDLLRPYFLVHFRDLRFNESATPLDYDEISKDAEFLNLVDYPLQLVRQNHIPLLQHATSEMRNLIEATALELGR